ncbi:MAG: hypothetical protein ACFE8J_11115 [Candidatus Heimdallarchaeota archaeon]
MNEEKKKRLKGFPNVVAKQVEPLNTNEKFIEEFKDTNIKWLLNATDGKFAALLIINKGKINVEGIENTPKKNLKKNNAGWDGKLSAKTQIFVDLLTSEDLTFGSVLGKVLTFRLRIRKLKKVLILLKLFEF